MVYDIPKHEGSYRERYSVLGMCPSPFLTHFKYFLFPENYNSEGKLPSFVKVAPKVRCTGISHMEVYFHNIIEGGGEGIILRDPGALYQPGRSPSYLKHKVTSLSSN